MVARQTSPGGSDPQESAVSSFFGAFLPSVLLLFVVFPDIGPEPVQLSSINLIFAHQGMFDLFGMLGRLPQPVPDGRFLVAFHPRETRQAHSLCHKSERFDNFVFWGALARENCARRFREGLPASLAAIALSPVARLSVPNNVVRISPASIWALIVRAKLTNRSKFAHDNRFKRRIGSRGESIRIGEREKVIAPKTNTQGGHYR
jgi:hypothetical protein